MSRIGGFSAPQAPGGATLADLGAVRRSAAAQTLGPIDADQPRRERAFEQLDGLSVEEELAAALFEEASGAFADPATLRPAGVKAVLEELQRDLSAMQAAGPEDLIELALGVLEDELANAERLQMILQRATNR